jgi:hypothetical protein
MTTPNASRFFLNSLPCDHCTKTEKVPVVDTFFINLNFVLNHCIVLLKAAAASVTSCAAVMAGNITIHEHKDLRSPK